MVGCDRRLHYVFKLSAAGRGGSDSNRLKYKGFESQRSRHRIMVITEPLADELLTSSNNASRSPLPPPGLQARITWASPALDPLRYKQMS